MRFYYRPTIGSLPGIACGIISCALCLAQEPPDLKEALKDAISSRDAVQAKQILLRGDRQSLLGDNKSGSALLYAVKERLIANAHSLLQARAHVNARDKHGDTPRFWAIYPQQVTHRSPTPPMPEMVALLLAHGSKINVRNREALTPLRVALED